MENWNQQGGAQIGHPEAVDSEKAGGLEPFLSRDWLPPELLASVYLLYGV